ncbi:dnaJ subfamily C member 2-like protein [Cinnamomum micranthum f. kanehirae]|uniref:DnaJ subfamily C member 2-like protein n=1 Tax=Cinnamomum micranthum f. kanehirae TaxID=337451 RepID=A0A3S3PVD9_9MAGN|nr:dnaJ subfamily C member 2-like protein [Cinnamomum micranthum f. kanehirae]
MESLEEKTRPGFLFQNRISSAPNSNQETPKLNKIQALCFTSISISLLLSFFYISSDSQTLQFLLVWISVSLLLAPFAPISTTGDDISVGKGDLFLPPPTQIRSPPKNPRNGSPIADRRPDYHPSSNPIFPIAETKNPEPKITKLNQPNGGSRSEVKEEEWTDEDFDLLKKQIAKHPVGAPRRWEVIAEAFCGRHGLKSVIKTVKSMAEKQLGGGGGDDFVQFLKQRKPLNKQAPGFNGELGEQTVVFGENGDLSKECGSLNWSSGEDIALLNALKAFPKDVPMRCEKIVAAVSVKSKACCMKRVTELMRDFRSSKASEGT